MSGWSGELDPQQLRRRRRPGRSARPGWIVPPDRQQLPTIRRVARRTELWNGNRERWRNLFTWDEQESVISWAWHRYPVYRQRYAAAARDPAYAHLRFIRVATRADARRLLDSAR